MLVATPDETLVAQIVRQTPLHYHTGAVAALDQPGHVRAASALACVAGRIVVVQDDANFLGIIDLIQNTTDALPLPAGEAGKRQFDDQRGNKRFKFDFEAGIVVHDPPTERLIAFGSGSSPQREQLLVVTWAPNAAPEIEVVHVPALYTALRTVDFAGSELNIEGAVLFGTTLRLFQRGNGALRDGIAPIDATCDLDWQHVWAYVQGQTPQPPALTNIIHYQLGELAGQRLTFTDATIGYSGILFTATAEASADAISDGPVTGSVIGIIRDEQVSWTAVRDQHGAHYTGKIEGLMLDSRHPGRALAVVDYDQPNRPSDLCEIELTGFA
jgi:hypothetical protein